MLTVAPRMVDGRVEQPAAVTGSERLGTSPSVGTRVTLVAYNDGSSGSLWLTTDAAGRLVVVGVIGRRKQGGCREFTSHTWAFTTDVDSLVQRAEDDSAPDSDVSAGPDSCS